MLILEIAGLFLVIFLFILWIRVARKRRKSLADWAKSRGLAFNPARVTNLDSRFPRFDCLVRGSRRSATNVAVGDWLEHPFLAFDYNHDIPFQDEKGREKIQSRTFSAVIMGTKASLEPFLLRPRKEGDSDAMDFGLELVISDIKTFNQQFDVRARDPRWALQVLRPRTVDLLLSAPRFNIQFDTNYVIAYRMSLFSPEDFVSAGHVLERIIEELPMSITRGMRAAG